MMDRFFGLVVDRVQRIAQFQLLVYGCLILALWLLLWSMIDVSYFCEVIFVVMGKFIFPKTS